MIGILVLTHEDFGGAMLQSAELIAGDLDRCQAVGLYRGDDIAAFGGKVKQAIEAMDDGDGVLVFADLFGASPYNATALASAELKRPFKCVAGFSFPMLLEAMTARRTRGLGLDELARQCMLAGREGIRELFSEMNEARGEARIFG